MALSCLRLLFNRSKPLLSCSFSKILLHSLLLMCLGEHVKSVLHFCGICRHFGVPFGFFFSEVANIVKSVVLGMFVRGVLASKKNPCYFSVRFLRYLRTFRGLSWLLLFQSRESLLNLLFLRFLPHL